MRRFRKVMRRFGRRFRKGGSMPFRTEVIDDFAIKTTHDGSNTSGNVIGGCYTYLDLYGPGRPQSVVDAVDSAILQTMRYNKNASLISGIAPFYSVAGTATLNASRGSSISASPYFWRPLDLRVKFFEQQRYTIYNTSTSVAYVTMFEYTVRKELAANRTWNLDCYDSAFTTTPAPGNATRYQLGLGAGAGATPVVNSETNMNDFRRHSAAQFYQQPDQGRWPGLNISNLNEQKDGANYVGPHAIQPYTALAITSNVPAVAARRIIQIVPDSSDGKGLVTISEPNIAGTTASQAPERVIGWNDHKAWTMRRYMKIRSKRFMLPPNTTINVTVRSPTFNKSVFFDKMYYYGVAGTPTNLYNWQNVLGMAPLAAATTIEIDHAPYLLRGQKFVSFQLRGGIQYKLSDVSNSPLQYGYAGIAMKRHSIRKYKLYHSKSKVRPAPFYTNNMYSTDTTTNMALMFPSSLPVAGAVGWIAPP